MNKYVYEYLDRLTDVITTKQNKFNEKIDSKLIKEIETLKKELEKDINSISKKIDEVSTKEMKVDAISLYKILDKVKMYTIKNGNWYFEDKDLGIKAVAKDGYTPIKGKDYFDGEKGEKGDPFTYKDFTKEQLNKLRGKDGLNGRDGRDGNDGYTPIKNKDYFDGKDAIIPTFEIGKIETITNEEKAEVNIDVKDNKLVFNFKIPKGKNGLSGKGRNAEINGYNTVTIETDNNIELEQTEEKITIKGNKLIPYTGATKDVDLGNYKLKANKLEAQTEIITEIVKTKNDYIILRDGAIDGLDTGEYTGFEANLYDGTNNGRLVFDKDGVARVGDVGDEQPLATREETPIDGGITKWNNTTKRFETTPLNEVTQVEFDAIPVEERVGWYLVG